MLKKFAYVAAAAAVLAPAAFAGECNAKEVEAAGGTAANLVRARVETVVAIQGKEMINLSACKTKGAAFEIEYKYNFMGPDGYYWVEGEGSITGASGTITFKKLSDKLESAAKAKNVTLASRD